MGPLKIGLGGTRFVVSTSFFSNFCDLVAVAIVTPYHQWNGHRIKTTGEVKQVSLSFLFSCLSYLEYKLPFPLQHIFWYLRYLQCSSSSHVEKLVVSSTSHEMTALASKSNSLSLTVLPHSCYITPVHLPSLFNRRKSHHRNPLPQLQKYFLPFFELKSSLFLARLP